MEEVVNRRIELKRDISDIAVKGTSGVEESSHDIISALMLTPKEDVL